jgi:alcohol dehydrogenase, propanol-preferring
MGGMRAWRVERPGPVSSGGLRLRDVPAPEVGAGDVLLRVRACGVCRTDLHVVEGDLPVHRPGVVPGHEIVGVVEQVGPAVDGVALGDRLGVPWLRRTCGQCRFCTTGRENLCVAPSFTGWDADGGYAELAVAPAAYAYRLPDAYDDEAAAPLLCAGIIGYRALRLADLPPSGRLGIWGYGGSAHLVAQLATAQGASVHVRTRSARARALALELGAASVGDSADPVDPPLDSAILFAPAGDLVPVALAALDRGGTLAVAGIHLSDVPRLDYQRHLFQERVLRSVTANAREDGRRFLELAARHRLEVRTVPYALDDADRALADLAADAFEGAAVLRPS